MSEKQSANRGQVVSEVIREEGIADANGSEALAPEQRNEALHLSTDYNTEVSESVRIDFDSPEISRLKSFNRSVFSKPKSRFGEPIDSNMCAQTSLQHAGENSPYRGSFNKANSRSLSSSSALRTASFLGRAKEMEEDEESYIAWIVRLIMDKKVFIGWIVFLCILGVLVPSFTVDKLDKLTVWGVEFWKWCVLVMVIFRGMLVANWFMQFIVYASKSNFWLRKKMLYFVHGMKQSVQVFMWLGMLLLTWLMLFDHGIERSKNSPKKILHYVTWSLVLVLIAAFLWSLKTLSLKILALRFYLHTFFDRTRESIFHQYVIQTLSGPPLMEMGQLSFGRPEKVEKEDIDMGNLLKMKLEEVSARTMEVLVDAVSSSAGLSTFSYTEFYDEGGEQNIKEIASEMEATAASYHIFANVAPPGAKYIEECDLLRFMVKEEVEIAFLLVDGAETGQFDRRALTDWVVKVYNARKGLIHSLTDTKKAVKQLDKLVTSMLIVISIVVWLLLVEIATTKVLVFLSSQIVLAAFLFGNTCKNIFEAIVFVFVMHLFHVGDRCLVDGILLIVEEMNILTTVFLKLNNDKFSIAFAPVEKIGLLKERIREYIEMRPLYLHPKHNVAVIDIENGIMLKMAIYFNYIFKSQELGEKEFGEKTKRRSDLVIQLMKILEELNITCSVQPPQSSSHLN